MRATSNFLLKLTLFPPAHSFSLLFLIAKDEDAFVEVRGRGTPGHEPRCCNADLISNRHSLLYRAKGENQDGSTRSD